MKRLRTLLLMAGGIVILLLAAALVGLHFYAQSAGAQARIQEQLGEALGLPLQITSVSAGWSGVEIAGVRIPDGERNLLEAHSFSAEYALWPLLRRQLVIKKMVLEEPKVLWAQNAEGKWVLPVLPEKGRKVDATLPNAAAPNEKPGTSSGENFQVVLDTLEVHGGSIELLDAQQHKVATATKVEMQYSLRTAGRVEGKFSAERVLWEDAFALEQVQSPLVFEKGVLSLPELKAQVAGGKVQARLEVQTEAHDSPFTLAVDLTGVDVGQLTVEGGWEPDQAAGTMGGKVELHGTMEHLDRTEGAGALKLTEVQLKQLDLFQTIGLILQIPELADLKAQEGALNFHVGDSKTTVDNFVLETRDLQLSMAGTVGYDGGLDLQAKLAVSHKLGEQLPSFVRNNFSPEDDKGRRAISFEIGGTTTKPKPNLVDRVIGHSVTNQVTDLLSGLFGKPKDPKPPKEKKEKKKKEKMEEPAVSGDAPAPASPEATALPAPAAPPAPVAPVAPSPDAAPETSP